MPKHNTKKPVISRQLFAYTDHYGNNFCLRQMANGNFCLSEDTLGIRAEYVYLSDAIEDINRGIRESLDYIHRERAERDAAYPDNSDIGRIGDIVSVYKRQTE
jgi:hypothetical protein